MKTIRAFFFVDFVQTVVFQFHFTDDKRQQNDTFSYKKFHFANDKRLNCRSELYKA